MISVKNSYEIAYNGTENECRFEMYADTSADLQGLTHIDGIKIQMGSECTDIATGDKYILNGSGAWILQPSDRAFSNVYTKPEIDSMITEIYGVIAYYHTTLVSDSGEITFYSLGGNVGTWAIYGNGQQTGTPTPDNPIMPTFCGTLDGTDWTIPITCGGETTPVYLGEVPTVRRVKKLVLTGQESTWSKDGSSSGINRYRVKLSDAKRLSDGYADQFYISHYGKQNTGYYVLNKSFLYNSYEVWCYICVDNTTYPTIDDYKAFLASEYSAGTPVTIWYVLATEQTGIVNEPLRKIGDYFDELHSTDGAVTIPTVKGSNTLTVDTTLKPSKIEISGER